MSKKNVISIFLCLGLTLVVIFTIRGFQYLIQSHEQGSYDYDSIINKGYDWVGPKAGENLEFNYLVDENSNLLSQSSKNNLILLSVVDSECGASKISKDQMKFLEDNLKDIDVDYYVISFSQKLSPSELSQFVKSMDLSSRPFLWTKGYENTLPSINKMVLPSHILTDSKGNIIKTFPGTSNEKFIRQRMANQIVGEVSAEKIKFNSN